MQAVDFPRVPEKYSIITRLAHFRLRPLSSLSNAESELLRDNDPGEDCEPSLETL